MFLKVRVILATLFVISFLAYAAIVRAIRGFLFENFSTLYIFLVRVDVLFLVMFTEIGSLSQSCAQEPLKLVPYTCNVSHFTHFICVNVFGVCLFLFCTSYSFWSEPIHV